MGGTLSCDVCKRVIECDNPDTSEHVYTLTKEKDKHVCGQCYTKDPSKYGGHIKELGYDIWHAAFVENMEGPLGDSLEKAAKSWGKGLFCCNKTENCSKDHRPVLSPVTLIQRNPHRPAEDARDEGQGRKYVE